MPALQIGSWRIASSVGKTLWLATANCVQSDEDRQMRYLLWIFLIAAAGFAPLSFGPGQLECPDCGGGK